MLRVAVHGPDETAVDDVPPPDPGPADVVVRVAACGICGSDLSYIASGGFCVTGGPMPLGHEIAGVVDWVGPEVAGTAVGDRVVVNPGDPYTDGLDIIGNGGAEGGLAELLVVRNAGRGSRVFPVPDDMALDVAALTEPVAVGMKSALRTGAESHERVAVFGCGPIGLAAIATLVDRGIDVVGIDLSARRRELAGAIGAAAVVDPATADVWDELVRHHGAADFMGMPNPATDAYVEATGAGSVLAGIVERARPGGRVSVVAMHHEPVAIDFVSVMAKQLELRGSMGYPERFTDAIDLLGRRDLGTMITHKVALDRFDDALAVLSQDKDCGKVLVTPGGAE